MTQKIFRRRLLVDTNFQTRFIFRFIVFSVAGIVGSLILFTYLAHRKIEAVQYTMLLPQSEAGAILVSELLWSVACGAIIILGGYVFMLNRLNRSINQPLNRLAQAMRKMADGDLSSPVQLRHKDNFQEVADSLNGLTLDLNRYFTGVHKALGDMDSCLQADTTTDDFKERLTACLQQLEREIHSFKK